MEYETRIIKSKRKTMALEIREPGILIVRVPGRCSDARIRKVIAEHEKWIRKHMALAERKSREREDGVPLTDEEIVHLKERAKEVIPEIVMKYAKLMDVDYQKITIRRQKTRWGSCSSKGNLNFNCLLMLAPTEVLEYVVVHELAHRKEMNHSPRFWNIVKDIKPDYMTAKIWLREEGAKLIR